MTGVVLWCNWNCWYHTMTELLLSTTAHISFCPTVFKHCSHARFSSYFQRQLTCQSLQRRFLSKVTLPDWYIVHVNFSWLILLFWKYVSWVWFSSSKRPHPNDLVSHSILTYSHPRGGVIIWRCLWSKAREKPSYISGTLVTFLTNVISQAL